MVVTNIIPCIKVTKENNMSGMDIYIDLGSKIRVTDNEGKVIEGRLLFLELAKDEEEDDMLYLLLDNKKQFSIGISYIIDIEEL
ncbi:hypothetical protein ACSXC4_13860 [Clostridium perfringens]|uniref:Uncharacterized protein n=1 Tax=Clostridium sulfidigenes TaxID=318464 RepID=A0A084J8H1_9CLOT|nr:MULTISPECIES: hypothetical protein [Eubacteriales]AQW25122.1 hypothetical protein BXT91_14855 [Clostridium perfringens]EHK2328424.1 hypothetical protein [Clostridium perfringens]EJT5917472.1 hypothetical protein [Clostridium perfringens]EJT5918116.1 hypothetical protein [Clostridium perfringens]EJT6136157.1 hypothetical protein [Clostridium perfringens]